MATRSAIASRFFAIGRKSPCAHDPAHVLLGPCLDPHRVGAAQEKREGFRVRDNAAGGRNNGGLLLGNHTIEARALVSTKGGQPRHLDEIGNGRAVILLDQTVELDERGSRARSASLRPSVDLPAPRSPISAIAPARDRPRPRRRARPRSIRQSRCSSAAGDASQQIENAGHGRRAPVTPRQKIDDRHDRARARSR